MYAPLTTLLCLSNVRIGARRNRGRKGVNKMEEELKEIVISLMKWGKKYDKRYVDVFSNGNCGTACLSCLDEDYAKCNFLIDNKEANI